MLDVVDEDVDVTVTGEPAGKVPVVVDDKVETVVVVLIEADP